MFAVLPLLVIFAAAYGAKRAGFLSAHDGGVLLRVIFHITLPPLVFLSVLYAEVDGDLVRLALLPPTVVAVSLAVVFVLRRSVLRELDARTFAAFMTAVVVMNTGFLLPFVQRLSGPEGLARLAILDTVGGIVTFSVVYAIVVRVSRDTAPDVRYVVGKLLVSPPLWGLAAAVLVRASGLTPPKGLLDTFDMAASTVGTVVLIALGLKFEPSVRRPRLLALSLGLRFGLGAVVGLAFIRLVGLEGLDARIALLGATAPLGVAAVTFSELENLDVEFAASVVSVGLMAAVLASPVTMRLIQA